MLLAAEKNSYFVASSSECIERDFLPLQSSFITDSQVLGWAGMPTDCIWNAFHCWMLHINILEMKAGMVATLPVLQDWQCRRGLDRTSAEPSADTQGHKWPTLEAHHFWELSNCHTSKLSDIS